MKSLFPEIEREVLEDRKAARRERAQRMRDYLRTRDFSWLINQLLEGGPQTEHVLLMRHLDENGEEGLKALLDDLLALWRVRKLWRVKQGRHIGSGLDSFLWGIPKVHPRPSKKGAA